MERALDEERRTTEQGGERPGQRYGEVDVPVRHVLRGAAPRPGEAEAYDAGRDHQRCRKQEARPRAVAVEHREREGYQERQPDRQDHTGVHPDDDSGVQRLGGEEVLDLFHGILDGEHHGVIAWPENLLTRRDDDGPVAQEGPNNSAFGETYFRERAARDPAPLGDPELDHLGSACQERHVYDLTLAHKAEYGLGREH